ncbi:uncharacterized protein METZ01_LOCUS122063 [marine metagenome]|uniref:Uncharacterized protein n=1 Tax=marine metagenome TaxID=408172 RepID=A0A381XWQ3_9ZZZZ
MTKQAAIKILLLGGKWFNVRTQIHRVEGLCLGVRESHS